MYLQSPKNCPVINTKSMILAAAAEGNINKAKEILKSNPGSLLEMADMTDLSGRSFKSLSALQYAAISCDIEMLDLFKKYLPKEEFTKQLMSVNQRNGEQEKNCFFYNCKELIERMQQYIDELARKNEQKDESLWHLLVSEKQRLMPAWLVYLWCEKGEDTEWLTGQFTHTVNRDFDANPEEEIPLYYWFKRHHNEDGTEKKVAFYRGASPLYFLDCTWRASCPTIEDVQYDKRCLETLLQSNIAKYKLILSEHEFITKTTTTRASKPGFFTSAVNQSVIPMQQIEFQDPNLQNQATPQPQLVVLKNPLSVQPQPQPQSQPLLVTKNAPSQTNIPQVIAGGSSSDSVEESGKSVISQERSTILENRREQPSQKVTKETSSYHCGCAIA